MTRLYNGDSKTDLLWWYTGNNQLAVWELAARNCNPALILSPRSRFLGGRWLLN